MDELTWKSRLREKLAWATALGSTTGAALAVATNKPVFAYSISTTTSTAIAAVLFGILQEGAQVARGDTSDAWNSVIAGGAAGAMLVGTQAGPRYRLMGALAWGPICGLGHLLFSMYPPTKQLEEVLIRAQLLDKPMPASPKEPASSRHVPASPSATAPPSETAGRMYQIDFGPAAPGHPTAPDKEWEDMDPREQSYWIQRLRQQDVQEIAARQQQEAAAKRQKAGA